MISLIFKDNIASKWTKYGCKGFNFMWKIMCKFALIKIRDVIVGILEVRTALGNIFEPCFETEISCTAIKFGLVMLVTIQLVLVYVVLVQGGSLASIGLPGLGDAAHTHHRYHTTNMSQCCTWVSLVNN